MAAEKKNGPSGHLDLHSIDFISVLERLDEGIIITDGKGDILFYNHTQGEIDGIEPEQAIGRNVKDIYDLTEETSMILQCIRHRRAIRNRSFFYKTHSGKVANTIHSIFPLLKDEEVRGAICFVKDYKILRQITPLVAGPEQKTDHGNGTRFTFADIIGSSPDFQRAVKSAQEAANSRSPIMLFGETGTGKELFAQSIHNHSNRRKKSYIAVNCSAIPESLLEGVLFGTTKGAFTGAMDKPGLFEQANGGTLFLDELLAMPYGLQAKLLRVLQEKKVRRVGSLNETQLDVKIVSSVNMEPRQAVKEGLLRTDLFYRLGVVMIKIPPLRERVDDMGELARHFIVKLNNALGTHVKSVSPRVMALFKEYNWPGNIREMEHLIEGAMNIVGQEEIIDKKHLAPGFDTLYSFSFAEPAPSLRSGTSPSPEGEGAPPSRNLFEIQAEKEKEVIEEALERSGGNVTRASELLGISRQLLHYKLKKFKFNRKDFVPP